MEERLTQAQLTKIVGEVERLSQRQQEELSPEQVKEVLVELNLPPELLNEAMVQLRRREALEAQQKRNRSITIGVVAAVAAVVAGIAFFVQQNQQTLARVSASRDAVNVSRDETLEDVMIVPRSQSQEIYYHVALQNAPVGKKLSLSCDWIAPNGQVVKQNHYETKQITNEVWNTYCKYSLDKETPTGAWQVKMSLQGRQLSDDSFEVK